MRTIEITIFPEVLKENQKKIFRFVNEKKNKKKTLPVL